ncbi:MAG: TonB family protein [Nitrospirae bacterium]|nr:TonB family protein [Nitrospirota bacterium]
MRQSRSIGKEPHFSRIILFSAILHFLFIFLVVIPIKTRQEEFRSYRVSLVGPIQTLQDSRDTKVRTAPAQEPAKVLPKTDMSLESFEQVKKEIERLHAIKDLKESAKKQEAVNKRIQEIQISKGKGSNKTSQEPDIQGRGTGQDTDFYYNIISRKIWQQWTYPNSQASGLEVIISIKIDKHGKVVSQELEKPSGNELLDRSAIRAIAKASPLPPTPEEMEIGVKLYT